MSPGSDFLKQVFNNLHPETKDFDTSSHDPIHVAQAASYILPTDPEILDVLISNISLQLPLAISCLCRAGQEILSHVISPTSRRSI
jgi:hypothetical protein